MKKPLLLILTFITIFGCNKNDLIIPEEYESIMGTWESYRFEHSQEYPGSHGNNYFITEYFGEDSIPYVLQLNLNEDSWSVYSDKTFICGDDIDGYEINNWGSYFCSIALLEHKKRKIVFDYYNNEISFTTISSDYLSEFTTIYLKRLN